MLHHICVCSLQARRNLANPKDMLFTGSPGGDMPPGLPLVPLQPVLEADGSTRKTPPGDLASKKVLTPTDGVLMPPTKVVVPKSRPNSGSYTQLPRSVSI